MDRQRVVLTRLKNGYAIRSFDFNNNIFEVFTGKKSKKRAVRYTIENGLDLMNNDSCIPADPLIQGEKVTA